MSLNTSALSLLLYPSGNVLHPKEAMLLNAETGGEREAGGERKRLERKKHLTWLLLPSFFVFRPSKNAIAFDENSFSVDVDSSHDIIITVHLRLPCHLILVTAVRFPSSVISYPLISDYLSIETSSSS